MYVLAVLAMLLAGQGAAQVQPKLFEIGATVIPLTVVEDWTEEGLGISLATSTDPGTGTIASIGLGIRDLPGAPGLEYRISWTGRDPDEGWGASPGAVDLRVVADTDGAVTFYAGGSEVATYESGVTGGFAYASIGSSYELREALPPALGFRDVSVTTVEGIVYEWTDGQPMLGWQVYGSEPYGGGFSWVPADSCYQRDGEYPGEIWNSYIALTWPQDYERAQGCVRYGTLNTPWRYRNYAGLYEHRVITDDTTQEATGGGAAALWPTGWVWPDGTHGVLYELGGDTVYRRASGPTWSAGATRGTDRTRPVMTQLAPSNDLLIAWMDGAACKCKRLRWGGAAYATTEIEYTIAASMVRPGSIDQLPDGRLVFVGENSAGVGYSLSSDDGATWSEFTALVAGAAYPVACRLSASQDLLMAYADQPWGEATISVCRVAWDGSAYAVAAGSTVAAMELGGAGQHPMDYLNSVDAIFERASGVPVLLLSLFNRLTGTAGYYSALIMQSDDGGTTWTETLLS